MIRDNLFERYLSRAGLITIGLIALIGSLLLFLIPLHFPESRKQRALNDYTQYVQHQLDQMPSFRHVLITLAQQNPVSFNYIGHVGSQEELDRLREFVDSLRPPGEVVWHVEIRQQEVDVPVQVLPVEHTSPPASPLSQSPPAELSRQVGQAVGARTTPPRSKRPIDTNLVQILLPGNRLPLYELRMQPSDLRKLDQSPGSDETYPAVFAAEGQVYPEVKVRYRGEWARSWPKKCLKILFPPNRRFDGHGCVNLNSAWRDPAFIREPLAYYLYHMCGVPAPRARMVRLHLNGQFRGLYVEVEEPKKAFLSRWKLADASIIKASTKSGSADERDLGNEQLYHSNYERETGTTEGFPDLWGFCRELAQTRNGVEFFTRHVEIETYVNYLAVTVLIQNWDCYNKNHYLVYDGEGSQKWFVVPWDLDRTFGDHWNRSFGYAQLPIFHGTRRLPGVTGWNRLADRFLNEPALRSRFLDRLEELLEKEFTREKLFPVVDRLALLIRSEAALDRRQWPGGTRADLPHGVAQLKQFILDRRAFLFRELAACRRSP